MMARLLSALTLAALATVPATAADIPARMVTKAPAAIVSQTWTGCYVGGNAGVGWTHKDWYDPLVGAGEGSNTSAGAVAGGQLGCDYQSGAWVFGIQGMFDWTGIKGSHPYTDDPAYTDESKISWFATVTGRVGYLVQPTTLLYVKGGGAWVRDTFTESCAPATDPACPGVARATRSGWTVGGGIEHKFNRNWSTFIEYNYMDFGRRRSTLVYADGSTYDYDIKQDVQTVLIGINYRFGGGPVW